MKDEQYEAAIDRLIPLASHYAYGKVKTLPSPTEERKGKDGKMFNWDFFTQFFHEEMNRLAREKGLR